MRVIYHGSCIARFMHRVTLAHTQRYHAKTKTRGYGHIYQGRYKSILVQQDRYFLTLMRYVERNAKRASLARRAEDWQWSRIHGRLRGSEEQKKLLSAWPVEEPKDYVDWINQSELKEEMENIRYAIKRSKPYGSDQRVNATAKKFGPASALQNPWRPKKGT